MAYGYATQMCILARETGRVKKMVAAHDVGKAVNPLSCEGQIEGGVVMSLGYALTEQYPIDENCKPTAKYGMLGLFRANQIPPEIQAIVVEKPGLNVAGGAIGIGEIASIPVVLHLDHGRDFDSCKAAIDGGYTSVMIDGSSLPFEENVELTREVVKYAHERGVSVEGELGVLAGVEDHVFAADSTYTNPLKAVEFFKKTQVDALAISYGTMHGAS